MRLKTYRDREKLTLEAFGSLIGRSKSTVQRYEEGIVTPSLKMARRIELLTAGAVGPADFYDTDASHGDQAQGAAA